MQQEKRLLEQVAGMLFKSNHTVVVTGAGISTEAGIPDFRGEKGIYRKLGEDRVMKILNIRTFKNDPELFYDFYFKHLFIPRVEPGRAHRALAGMEKRGFIKCIVTQNIDNLHQKAGSQKVVAVHGSADRYLCTKPGCCSVYDADYIRRSKGKVPTCSQCGAILKPDVVLFGEPIQNHRLARETIMSASCLLVIGSSLMVYPLAGFVEDYGYTGRPLIILNKGRTALDHLASLKVDAESTGAFLKGVSRLLFAGDMIKGQAPERRPL